MEISKECEALETKIRGFCSPPIYLNPKTYEDQDSRLYTALVKKIVVQAPLDAQQILINENVFTQLQHFKDMEFYQTLYNYISQNKKLISASSYFTLLPYEQWTKKQFCSMKMRIIGVFVDIIKQKLTSLYKKQARILQKEQDAIPKPEPVLEVDQNMAGSMQPYNGAERITKQFESNYKPFSTSNKQQETNPENEYRQSLTVHDKTEFKQKMEEKINERDFMKEAQNANGTLDQINLIKMLQRIEMKIDAVAARVENVENTVRGLWIEILK
ncbi:Conserved_hypothetical protein [Hexamita inflata]|uniref:Uncharacterized protein n=1 Tax=Hexamita inflata TaxID=28002 RepID=A0AA86R4M6_9EUKA|nr:Conserved hypothetical protein [Hexamita inflata]